MSMKFVLNETSYFGKGSRNELSGEIKKRDFKNRWLFKKNIEIKDLKFTNAELIYFKWLI